MQWGIRQYSDKLKTNKSKQRMKQLLVFLRIEDIK